MSNWEFLNKHRVTFGPYGSTAELGWNGAFTFAVPGEARRICCVASDQEGWKHVSVSFGALNRSCPSWQVMCAVKDLFWEPEDVVIQFHPRKSEYRNLHEGCLHLWQCIDGRETPMPPPMILPASVFSDGTRILTQSDFMNRMGMYYSGWVAKNKPKNVPERPA